ncbi:MAG TPA: response regulator transcription factor [Chloroflexota bacterium]|nr:response regulator transcription factor [Chloroflexota bacterium]
MDDDIYLTDLLRYALSHDGYAVEVANTGADALRTAQADPPDVVVLDVNLPDVNGFTLCNRFRKVLHLPVIMLTARSLDTDMVTGFQQGADDYVAKPFSMQVLSYRIRAVVIRRGSAELEGGPSRTSYPLGAGTFDAEQHEVLGGVTIKLTPIQGKILRVLLEHEGRVVSAEQLMTKVWHYDAESDVSVVKTHISNLRKKIATALGEAEIIRTVPGLGYMFRQPSSLREDAS